MLKKHLIIALAFLFMVGFAACETDHNDAMTEAGDQDRTAGEVLDDTVITSTIKAELLADSDVSGLDIDVDTMEGEVTLSGTVESEIESLEAEAIAKSVDGVVSVTNNLVVDETADEDTDAQDTDTDDAEENTSDGQGY